MILLRYFNNFNHFPKFKITFCWLKHFFAINSLQWHHQWDKTLKIVNNCLNTNIYPFLETSGVQSSDLYLNVVNFSTPVLIRNLWQLKTAVFLHRSLKCAVLLLYLFNGPRPPLLLARMQKTCWFILTQMCW